MKKIKEITSEEADKIFETKEPRGLFFFKEEDRYFAIDNLTGEVWTEDFRSKEGCINYLKESVPYHIQCFSPD